MCTHSSLAAPFRHLSRSLSLVWISSRYMCAALCSVGVARGREEKKHRRVVQSKEKESSLALNMTFSSNEAHGPFFLPLFSMASVFSFFLFLLSAARCSATLALRHKQYRYTRAASMSLSLSSLSLGDTCDNNCELLGMVNSDVARRSLHLRSSRLSFGRQRADTNHGASKQAVPSVNTIRRTLSSSRHVYECDAKK